MRRVVDASRVRAFCAALGRVARRPSTLYLVGGSTAVVEGWRATTTDIDLRLEPDYDELVRAISSLKNELEVNVEFASPELFVPVADGWQDRSPWVATEGQLTVRHFDPTAQALAKLSRGHRQDLVDVVAMFERGLVSPGGLKMAFDSVVDQLYRYPALDEARYRSDVTAFLQGRKP